MRLSSIVCARPAACGLVLLSLVACSGKPPGRPGEDSGGAKPAGERSWPMWGGTNSRNLVNLVEKNVPTSWSVQKGKEKNVKWTARLGTISYGGPVVAGGKVFVSTNNNKPRDPAIRGDKGVLMCFRESDGKFLWQAVHDKLPNTQENDSRDQGIVSTPVVEGNRVYYVSNRCELVCADTEGTPDGKAKFIWKLDMMGDLGVYPCQLATCSPLIVGDLVYAITGNGVSPESQKVPAPKAPDFIAVDKRSGKVVWSDNSPGDRILDGQWSNPVAAEVNGKTQVIFPGGDGYLYAFEAKSGNLLWKFNCNPKGAVYKHDGTGTASIIIATPVVWENKLYVGVGLEPDYCRGPGHLWCVDITKEPKNKDKDLSPVNDNFDPKAAVNKDSGLVWHHGGPILPKPEEGREEVFGRTMSTVAVHDGLCYAVEMSGFVQCLDARTGKKYWEYDMKDGSWSSPYWVDGKVYVGSEGGTMFIFKHGKELKEPEKVEMNQALKIPPVAVNGVLFINEGIYLHAIAPK